MGKICQITGKKSVCGGGYSNRTRATKFNPTGKVRKQINLQKKKVFVPSLNKTVKVAMTGKALRTLKRKGTDKTLRSANII